MVPQRPLQKQRLGIKGDQESLEARWTDRKKKKETAHGACEKGVCFLDSGERFWPESQGSRDPRVGAERWVQLARL